MGYQLTAVANRRRCARADKCDNERPCKVAGPLLADSFLSDGDKRLAGGGGILPAGDRCICEASRPHYRSVKNTRCQRATSERWRTCLPAVV
uniref:Uncharacterized protein n=1 Tax=Plectus sambesii TaxID=2011161 RepID=A0A914X556_9BILA